MHADAYFGRPEWYTSVRVALDSQVNEVVTIISLFTLNAGNLKRLDLYLKQSFRLK